MSNRTVVVMKAIGWQGGTVHDLCKTLGLNVNEFLYATPKNESLNSDYTLGWFGGRTSPEFIKNDAIVKYHGNLDFWIGVARGLLIDHEKTVVFDEKFN